MLVRTIESADVPPALLISIRQMLDEAFDGDFSDDDWDHTVGGVHVLVSSGEERRGVGDVVAHAAVVPRRIHVDERPFHCGYVEGVATARRVRRRGLGSRAVTAATDLVRGTYEIGALSTGSHTFYESLGWERWRGPTFVRIGARTIRTADEDDGIMVLRTGASAAIDLGSAISCEARSGDDW